MVCWPHLTSSGLRGTTTAHPFSINRTTPTIDSTSINNSKLNSPYWWNPRESQILMKWTTSREPGCQTIREFQRIGIFTVSWVGFLTSMWSALKITIIDTRQIENISTAQWTTTWLSIIQPWLTPSSSGKMLQPSLLPEKKYKPWASRTDQSMGQRWDRLRVSSKLLCMPLHSFLTVTFQIDGRLLIKWRRPNNSQIPSHSWESQKRTGRTWLGHLADGVNKWDPNPLAPQIIRSLLASAITAHQAKSNWDQWQRKDLNKFAGKMDGILTSSQFQNTMRKFTPPWKFRSKESEKLWFD